MISQVLSGLQVIGVRYRQSHLAVDDERSLDAYTASGVYKNALVPYHYDEPHFPEQDRVQDEPAKIGLLGGLIAQQTNQGLRQGNAVLMTGGDCSHCSGVLGGLQMAYGAGARIGMLWFDAHGDFNTPRTTLSRMLGGMPLAVCAGLAHPHWRTSSMISAPLPTDRIVMVDVRHLDTAEEQLIRATDIVIAAPAPGFRGANLEQAVNTLADKCDILYLHVDSDILDERFTPSHRTREPNGPDLEQVNQALEVVMRTGKVAAFAVVSSYNIGDGKDIMVQSATALISAGLQAWRQYGMPALPVAIENE